MDDVLSAIGQLSAVSQQQASLIAMRNEAQTQQRLADMLSQQAQQAQERVMPASNPPGVGTKVDTHA